MTSTSSWLRKINRYTRIFGLCDRCGVPFRNFKACYHVYSFPMHVERCHWRCISVGDGIMKQESRKNHMPRKFWKENLK